MVSTVETSLSVHYNSPFLFSDTVIQTSQFLSVSFELDDNDLVMKSQVVNRTDDQSPKTSILVTLSFYFDFFY